MTFYDYSSPYAYLAATQLEALARALRAVVEYRPILLGGLFRSSIGTPQVPMHSYSDAKQRHVRRPGPLGPLLRRAISTFSRADPHRDRAAPDPCSSNQAGRAPR